MNFSNPSLYRLQSRLSRTMSTNLRILSAAHFPSYWPPQGIATFQPQPLAPRPYNLIELTTPASFEISEKLYVGKNKWSQVLRGSFKASAKTVYNDVVLKIYCESLHPRYGEAGNTSPPVPFSRIPSSNVYSHRNTAEIMAWQEAWAYGMLSKLQGGQIPQFHGVYQVESPESDETGPCLAVLMSFVEGESIVERCQELWPAGDILSWNPSTDNADWCRLIRDVYVLTHRIHQLGVAHLDIKDMNIKYHRPSGSVIFLDFAFSRPSRFETLEEASRHDLKRGLRHDEHCLSGFLLEMCGDSEVSEESWDTISQRRAKFALWAIAHCSNEDWYKAFPPGEMEALSKAR
ncbi:hypothetical protein DFP72DRAFT_928223 [Ephemerocybe angulata]|uniref:Protein kinase domain-containing protein n=1 Tax=Ephemerocybe angulata TaxID=980116 RepID=A0A8H6HCV9_9AGAR|nr:hypothetical protein DFP72DRAFT_928223 [Tulosesus angulatus]